MSCVRERTFSERAGGGNGPAPSQIADEPFPEPGGACRCLGHEGARQISGANERGLHCHHVLRYPLLVDKYVNQKCNVCAFAPVRGREAL